MGDSKAGILLLLLGGIVYAIFKLGDEFFLIFARFFDVETVSTVRSYSTGKTGIGYCLQERLEVVVSLSLCS